MIKEMSRTNALAGGGAFTAGPEGPWNDQPRGGPRRRGDETRTQEALRTSVS